MAFRMKNRYETGEEFYQDIKNHLIEDGFITTNKALKQEPVLDKIRAEINLKQYDFMADRDYDKGIRFGLRTALKIIDKYKVESEG